jgi:hypothetical protein
MKIRNFKIYKNWRLYAEAHGRGYFGANILNLPTIGIFTSKDYLQIGVGWLKWSYSFAFFNCL